MGTRGAFGFRVDGVDKVTYNHFDSYPDGLGNSLVEFVAGVDDARLLEIARGLRVIDGETPPTPAEIAKYRKWYDGGVGSQKESDWYCLLREAQGNPGAWANGLDVIVDGRDFLADSVWCEWAYIINVDEGVLEVYRGFNENPAGPGRFAALRRKETPEIAARLAAAGVKPHFGVTLKTTVPLAKCRGLTDGDLKALLDSWEEREDEDDEGSAPTGDEGKEGERG